MINYGKTLMAPWYVYMWWLIGWNFYPEKNLSEADIMYIVEIMMAKEVFHIWDRRLIENVEIGKILVNRDVLNFVK